MVHLQTVERQLRAVGCNYRFFGRPEVRELARILMPDETIAQAVNGTYEGGFAMLCVTDKRLLLIDRKPLFLTLEDIRYDMVVEIDYNYRLLNASVRIFTPTKELGFSSWSQARLRRLIEYLQGRVMEIRQHGHEVVRKQFESPDGGVASTSNDTVPAADSMDEREVLPSLGRTAFNASMTDSGGNTMASGRLVIPPRMTNPYARKTLPLDRRRAYPVY